jgi:hypothetical protein
MVALTFIGNSARRVGIFELRVEFDRLGLVRYGSVVFALFS